MSKPKAFPDFILRDAFCRFGDLIDAHFMSGQFAVRRRTREG